MFGFSRKPKIAAASVVAPTVATTAAKTAQNNFEKLNLEYTGLIQSLNVADDLARETIDAWESSGAGALSGQERAWLQGLLDQVGKFKLSVSYPNDPITTGSEHHYITDLVWTTEGAKLFDDWKSHIYRANDLNTVNLRRFLNFESRY